MNLHHSRQCRYLTQTTLRSHKLDYTVVCFMTHDCSRKLWKLCQCQLRAVQIAYTVFGDFRSLSNLPVYLRLTVRVNIRTDSRAYLRPRYYATTVRFVRRVLRLLLLLLLLQHSTTEIELSAAVTATGRQARWPGWALSYLCLLWEPSRRRHAQSGRM